MRWLFCIVLTTTTFACTSAAEKPVRAKQLSVGTLQIAPEVHPATPAVSDALIASKWIHAGLKNILGQGTDEVLTFKREDNGLTVERAVRTFHSVNQPGERFSETKTINTCTVDQYVIRYGDQQQTFVLIPDKALIVNALVPIGTGKWYFASRMIYDKPNAGFRDEEMLFDFAADPLQKDQGSGRLQLRSGDAGKIKKIDVKFELTRSDKNGRLIRVVADDPNKAVWAQIYFVSDGQYGQMLDQPDRNTLIFLPDKP